MSQDTIGEIRQLQVRLTTLERERDTAKATLEAAHTEAKAGRKTVQEVTAARLAHLTVDELVKDVSRDLEALRAQLDRETEAEEVARCRAAAIDAAKRADQALTDIDNAYLEAAAAIVPILEKARQARANHITARRVFLSNLERVAGVPLRSDGGGALTANIERLDIAPRVLGELERESGVSFDAVRLHSGGYRSIVDDYKRQPPAIPFRAALGQIEQEMATVQDEQPNAA